MQRLPRLHTWSSALMPSICTPIHRPIYAEARTLDLHDVGALVGEQRHT